MNGHYIVASDRPWGRYAFEQAKLPENWHFVDWLRDSTSDIFERLAVGASLVEPRFIFFVHWSAKVPVGVTDKYEAINFHMSDLPFGRGGSPLQNLIERGYKETVITAHRMTQEIDAGPIYMKQPLSLEGAAEEIYLRAATQCIVMAQTIAREESVPIPQDELTQENWAPNLKYAIPETFKRRTPAQSRIPYGLSLEALFDHIRMLDAEGYPQAFLEYGGYRLEFSRASLKTGRIVVDVSLRESS